MRTTTYTLVYGNTGEPVAGPQAGGSRWTTKDDAGTQFWWPHYAKHPHWLNGWQNAVDMAPANVFLGHKEDNVKVTEQGILNSIVTDQRIRRDRW